MFREILKTRFTIPKLIFLLLSQFACRDNWGSKLKIEISSDSFWSHESRGGLRILKQANVRKLVFRGKQSCTVLHENSIYALPGLCFEKRIYPWTRLDE